MGFCGGRFSRKWKKDELEKTVKGAKENEQAAEV